MLSPLRRLLLLTALVPLLQVPAPAAERSAADLLPDSTVLFVEIAEPNALLRTVLDHPLRKRVEELEPYKEAISKPKAIQFRTVVKAVETQLGMTWDQVLGALTERGATLAFDPRTKGAALLIRSRDQKTLEKLRDQFFSLARADAKRKGNDDPVKTIKYRGITTYQIGNARVATIDSWLIVANNGELGHQILDRHLDGPGESLSDKESFQQASKTRAKETLWAWADVQALRDAGQLAAVTREKNNNPLLEIVAGGVAGTLAKAPYATLTLDVQTDRIALALAMPHKTEWVQERREYYFGPRGTGTAPAVLDVPGRILSLATYRNFSEMWMRSGDLFTEKIDAGFAEANANLSNISSGKDFGEEVLGAFKPEVQIVLARQTFDESQPVPTIKLPAFAVVFRFKDPAESKDEFRRSFQNLIGFLNVVGAMQGRPQFDMDFKKTGPKQYVTATYVPKKEDEGSKTAPIAFNFSPSVVFVEDRFVVSSTKGLAFEIADALLKPAKEGQAVNTALDVDLQATRDILADNRKQLVSRNMLEEGSDREAAEKQIGLLLEAVGALKQFRLELGTPDGTLRVQAELTLKAQDGGKP
jgi:hypothetical protein